MKKRYILYLLAIVTALLVGLYFAFDKGYILFNNPSFDKYPVQGIDISRHQEKIDWHKLKDEKRAQFVFIKITEGVTIQDVWFDENYKQAKANNIPVGMYHFFTFCRSGKEQAYNFLTTVPFDTILSLPPVIDLEYGGNCKKANRLSNLTDEIKDFLSIIETRYGRKVIIYTTHDFYEDYLIGQFVDNPIWMRDMYREPHIKDGRKWLFWQYSSRGILNGIDGLVDLNAFAGSKDEFQELLKRK